MDINENVIKEEVNNFLHNIKRIIPSKKDIENIIFKKQLVRLNTIHENAKDVFPNCFAGAKLVAVRELSDKIKLSQQYDYAVPKNTYRSFSHYLYKEMEPKSTRGFLIDTSGSATASYEEDLDDIGLKITSKIRHLVSSDTEITFDKGDKKGYASLSFSMQDVDPVTVKVVTQYIRKISENLYMGMEILASPFSSIPYPELAICGMYENKINSFSGTASHRGFQLSMYRKIREDLKIATIFDFGYYKEHITSSVAMKKDFNRLVTLKAFVDSNKCGGLTVEKNIYIRDINIDIRVLKLVGSLLVDNRRKIDVGIGFFLNL